MLQGESRIVQFRLNPSEHVLCGRVAVAGKFPLVPVRVGERKGADFIEELHFSVRENTRASISSSSIALAE